MMRGGRYWHGAVEKPKPNVSRRLLFRVLKYAKPYWLHIAGMLITITAGALLGLISPLIFREIIDVALPEKDILKLNALALGLVAIPLIRSGIRIVQRKLNVTIGEGVIYDLRVALYRHLQQMSLRFFTNTRTGELMSRLNNDVVGAQNAISNTIFSFATNVITGVATMAIMLAFEWRLTLAGVIILSFFIFIFRRLGARLQNLVCALLEHNSLMIALLN